MALSKYKIGDYIELVLEINEELKFGPDDVKGMTITKEIIPTKADVRNTDLSKFLVVKPNEFIFNPRTHGKKIGFGYNDSDKAFIISWNNIAFRIKDEKRDGILPDYLFLHFKRDEWDREACFNSWGSSTEVFSWEALCDMEVFMPSLPIQQKYVDIYKAMIRNQQSYERGLDDLKLFIDAEIEKIKHKARKYPLYELTKESDERNINLSVNTVSGVNREKSFMPTVASGADISKYKIVRKNQLACNLMHIGRDKVIPIAMNDTDNLILVSPAYIVLSVISEIIYPQFLLLWFMRGETDRKAWFLCDSSIRSGMEKSIFFEMEVPIPPIDVQYTLIQLLNVYSMRKEINEKLKAQIKEICPILIKGSIDEARREV